MPLGNKINLLYSKDKKPIHYVNDQITFFQHVDEENAYLCGYLKIKNLTDEYPEMVTFFDGEIISEKHPFLTRKWDADEDVDKKHWVSINLLSILMMIVKLYIFRASLWLSTNMQRILIPIVSIMKS